MREETGEGRDRSPSRDSRPWIGIGCIQVDAVAWVVCKWMSRDTVEGWQWTGWQKWVWCDGMGVIGVHLVAHHTHATCLPSTNARTTPPHHRPTARTPPSPPTQAHGVMGVEQARGEPVQGGRLPRPCPRIGAAPRAACPPPCCRAPRGRIGAGSSSCRGRTAEPLAVQGRARPRAHHSTATCAPITSLMPSCPELLSSSAQPRHLLRTCCRLLTSAVHW